MVFSDPPTHATNSNHHQQQQQQHSYSSATTTQQQRSSLHSQVHDAASVVGSRIVDVVSHSLKPETRNGLRDGWDTLVKVMFAPCAGEYDVGGVPREEALVVGVVGGDLSVHGGSGSGGRGIIGRGGGRQSSSGEGPWGASVPFEVTASPDRSFQAASSFVVASPQQQPPPPSLPTQELRQPSTIPEQQQQQQASTTPREQRRQSSRAKLRQLGARHQLASGFPGQSLADTARPISPADKEREEAIIAAAAASSSSSAAKNESSSPELVDFDDGISAISSHTLEEMERRRQVKEKKNVVRLHPLDFSQIIDENTELKFTEAAPVVVEEEERNTEVVFGQPFYQQDETDEAHQPSPTNRVVPPTTNTMAEPSTLNRVTSTKSHRTQHTQNTTITEDSNEFEEMYKKHEAMYWIDSDHVANVERSARQSRGASRSSGGGRGGSRSSQRGMSVEERARRLRELSRSRSRSDGTGSSNKSGSSSLVSGQHPHDTVPVYPSDLFTRRKKSSNSNGSSSGSRSRRNRGAAPASVMEDSDPFASLDYGEI